MTDAPLTAAQKAEFSECFKVFAGRGSHGHIGAKELMNAMKSVGLNPTEAEVTSLINEVDTTGKGNITEDQFLVMMAHKTKGGQAHEDEREFRAAFNLLDADQDGRISATELRTILKGFGEDLTTDEVDELIKEHDVDGDGYLGYEEFVKMLRHH
ncbi:hypothetical protein SmJEL517_g05469 [Synchytrium microbalum]|uniref:EF-hand domain-containing protein n=1 Tax=Synchytrium microbalum TaxID=1806994 RepID=A0A507BUA2_9FUNG|nr:uncharacterized protein SmJEL517_g05469 [Synchytrium microbalum]TPX31142.1 hypothetical protein SmJEL517_g05469 [Synchytrium microbalum]